MNFFFNDEFISLVNKLIKNSDHADCEKQIVKAFFGKNLDEIKFIGCRKLSGNIEKQVFIKKRLNKSKGKSSGYRLYFYLLVIDKDVYMLYIHPKTGNKCSENITDEKKIDLIKKYKSDRNNNSFIKVYIDSESEKFYDLESKKPVFKGKREKSIKTTQ